MIDKKYNRYEFYDYETTGVNSSFDQVVQFASISTDADLNVIPNSEANVIVRPRPDVVPSPMAFLTTNIDINILKQHGITEFELSRVVQDRFSAHDATAMSGYNTISFDDELTRTLMFRNMKSPYDHEWKNKNGRVDVFKLTQLTYAFFPDLIKFPIVDDKVSLRLEHLSKANGIAHDNAHDALSDVYATIGIAKIIKDKRPTLFQHFLNLTDKRNCNELLLDKKPVYLTTSFFDRGFHSTSLILPIVTDAENANKVHCVDLRYDPTELLSMSPEDIKKYLFTKREDLPEGSPKLPIVSVQVNKLPILTPFGGTMSPTISERFQLDCNKVFEHMHQIQNDAGFASRLLTAMISEKKEPSDAFSSIYSGGFIDNNDAYERSKMHYVDPQSESKEYRIEKADVFSVGMSMKDSIRQSDLLLRAKWNNFYERILTETEFSRDEFKEWSNYLERRLVNGCNDEKALTISQFKIEIKEARLNHALTDSQEEILVALEQHVAELEDLLVNLKVAQKTLDQEQVQSSQPYLQYKQGINSSNDPQLSR
ncbi:exodeoxyribonuclease I [Vibrio owensii]|uniref:exodeoxyribonuclease I n=1 Tax=Vibrio harveyi group TaxID=717610 RepID=UPI003CC5B520